MLRGNATRHLLRRVTQKEHFSLARGANAIQLRSQSNEQGYQEEWYKRAQKEIKGKEPHETLSWSSAVRPLSSPSFSLSLSQGNPKLTGFRGSRVFP